MSSRQVLVVGAGAAGSAAAAVMSQTDGDPEVVVVGEEDRPPYNRTTVRVMSGSPSHCTTGGTGSWPPSASAGLER